MENKTIYLIIISCWIILLSIICFVSYGVDKNRAQRNAWRISEKFLLLTAILGGAIGGFIGMKTFRHKTKHLLFKITNAFFSLLYIALIIYLSFFWKI